MCRAFSRNMCKVAAVSQPLHGCYAPRRAQSIHSFFYIHRLLTGFEKPPKQCVVKELTQQEYILENCWLGPTWTSKVPKTNGTYPIMKSIWAVTLAILEVQLVLDPMSLLALKRPWKFAAQISIMAHEGQVPTRSVGLYYAPFLGCLFWA